ncbi:MAG: hypothetical protein ACTTH5_00710 [Wolinella sp.]
MRVFIFCMQDNFGAIPAPYIQAVCSRRDLHVFVSVRNHAGAILDF